MTRLIDADELLMDFTDIAGIQIHGNTKWSVSTMRSAIRQAPTVDAVEVVHGEWITKCMEGSWTHYRYSCSNCGSGFDSNSNYCPNCGADMRVGRWKGEGMGDYSCSLCGKIVSGNHREECPNCHAKMDG